MHRPPCFVLCDSTKGPQRRDQKLSALGGQGQLDHFCISVWVLFSKRVPPPFQEEKVGIRSTYSKRSACPDLPGPLEPMV